MLYQEKLAPDGVLVLHISNRHLDLKPVVQANAADLDFTAVIEDDHSSDAGVLASRWALVARDSEVLAARGFPGGPDEVVPRHGRIWTDDYSDLWSVFQW